MSSGRCATTGELPLGGGALKGSLVADEGLGLRGRSWSHAWNETDDAVDHAVGAIERVGVGWCTDEAGYSLRFAAYLVDQGCLVNAREAFVNGHREIPCRAE